MLDWGIAKTYSREQGGVVQFLRYRNCGAAALAEIQQDLARWNSKMPKPIAVESSPLDGMASFVCAGALGTELGKGRKGHVKSDPPSLTVGQFLDAASVTVKTLAELHAAGLIHRNIKPSNIFVSSEGATLVDPVSEVQVAESLRNLRSRYVLERVLPYIAPEQTGRMARVADGRSDLYSLGIVLFEILTGAPPFAFDDPLEIIHAHLARRPDALERIRPELPPVLTAIVSRLLEKDPEQRYQSAFGLLSDLDTCATQWRTHASVASFDIGRADIPQTLELDGMLFGRESERSAIEQALAQASLGRPTLILLSGPPGIGKSALARLITRLAYVQSCHVGAGKCDQLGLEQPYFALRQALAEVGSQLLYQPEDILAAWKNRFDEYMEGLGGIVLELCPILERIVGPQDPLPPLEPIEGKARLRLAVQRLLKVIATCGHSLVLFVDDLQWADIGSLELLEHMLVTANSLPLLIIGAYRTTEVTDQHPVRLTAMAIEARGVPVHSCSLAPLSTSAIAQLLSASFGRATAEVRELAETIHQRTLGNPFFVRTFLQSLMAGGALRFDGLWEWNLEEIRTQQATSSVIGLLCDGMGQLAPETRMVLQYAAAIGSNAALADLMLALEIDLLTLLRRLEPAIAAKLVRVRDGRLVFLHDRIQEASLAMMNPAELAARHLAIANVFCRNFDSDELDSRLFEHVSHLNAGRSALPDSERFELARLNLKALRRAQAAAAFSTALELAQAGISCLGADDWDANYTLCFDLEHARAELALHLGDFVRAEALSLSLELRARNVVDRASAQGLRVKLYTVQARFDEAIESAQQALALLTVDMPTESAGIAARFREERARSERLLNRRGPSELMTIAPMTNPAARLALELLVRVNPAIFFRRPDMLGLNIVLMTNLSLEHGHTPASAFAYAEFGFLCALESANHVRAYEFTLLGLHLADLSLDPIQICRVTHLAAWIQHYTQPLCKADMLFRKGFQAACDSGEVEWAAYHAYSRAARILLLGIELETARREIAELREYVQRANSVAIVQLLDALCGQLDFLTQRADRAEYASRIESQIRLWRSSTNPQAEFIHRAYRSFTLLLEQRYDDACEFASLALILAEHAPNHPFVELAHFIRGIAAVVPLSPGDVIPCAATEEAIRLAALAETCPSNYRVRQILLEAELARVGGAGWEIGQRYSLACRHARETKTVQEEGLAHQLAARFWRQIGEFDFYACHARRACACWSRWGAWHLESLVDGELKLHAGFAYMSSVQDGFDMRSLIKSSQAISVELDRTKLLSRVMHVILENAGADRGALISPGPQGLELVVRAMMDGTEDLTVRNLDDDSWVLADVIRYADRTGESVVIDDAREDKRLSNNRQVALREVRSVLCLPIGLSDMARGFIYLENTLTTGAFTAERLAMVEILASQASISLENAELFARSQRAEWTLRASEEDLRITLDSIGDAVIATDASGCVSRMNPVACRLTGWTLEEARARPLRNIVETVHARTGEVTDDMVATVVRTGQSVERPDDTILASRTGTERRVAESAAPIRDARGEVVGVVLVFRDVTERHEMEERFRQTQKLEALGSLAGGVAHDFNNMLAGILGSAEFLATKLSITDKPALHWSVKTIIDSALRAGELTKQLLAFSRKGKRVSTRTDIHAIVAEALALLERSIDRRIRIERELCTGTPVVVGDPALLQSALLNLGINARDAMPNGGILRVSTRLCRLEQEECDAMEGYSLAPGAFVEVAVTDNGSGMPPEVLKRVFEPFYTTKPPGKGTGLGLAAVHGTMVEHGGAVRIMSRVGRGTTVLLLFPVHESEIVGNRTRVLSRPKKRHLLVLVIDDEPVARVTAVRLLESLGHRARVASDGQEGLSVFARTELAFDLVLLDVVMPNLCGAETFRQLRSLRCKAPIIMVSGFPRDNAVEQLVAEGLDGFLMKPYTRLALSRAIDAAMARKRREHPACGCRPEVSAAEARERFLPAAGRSDSR